jgi:4-hydroxy-tetrahydrodipicolinate synthase
LSVDLAATRSGFDALIKDGVDGLVALGTCGENNSLEAGEKRAILETAKEAAEGRVPLVAGVSELTTTGAVAFARAAQKLGANALMVLPAMVYVPSEDELFEHFRQVAAATSLPIMLYNNPPAYRAEITLRLLERLASVPNIVAVKESAPDSRRFTDVINAFGERYTLMAGLDDVAMEGLLLGAKGWVSGLTSAFPRESVAFIRALAAGRIEDARRIYRWFMPLLHLDAEHDLVQSIKLAEQMMGRGSERVRMPRLPLNGSRRAQVIAIVENAIASRPRTSLSDAA